ncbi:UNVERIFIED_CONTAM: hypothetical protein Sangu_3212700 [Sesamum angustifolium]|uniref:Uncharacterized protein n=1 Tax=Sesamum angustifolium TaxID=2727405 RepID=A0AAW2JM44_9LAMI
MKEVYAIPDRHTKYDATKEFFRAKMTEMSFVPKHVVKMLSLLETLEDLKAGLENSLPPSYDPFIVNFNINGLEKSINDLIKILGEWARERGRWILSSSRGKTISAPIAVRKAYPNLSPNQGIFIAEVNMVTNSASWVLDTSCGAQKV